MENMKNRNRTLKNVLWVVLFIVCARLGLFSWIEEVNIMKMSALTRALNSMATVADVHVNNKSVQLHHSEDTALTGFEVRNAKLKFLHQFKTPCWIEPFTDTFVYKKNPFFTKSYPHKISKRKLQHFHKKGVAYRNTQLCGDKGICRLRCLPYFMMIGVHKSGTTDLYKAMDFHPHILSSAKKEVYWWNQFRFKKMLGASLGDYADLFDGSVGKLMNYKIKELETGELYYPSVIGEYTAMTFFDMSYWRQDPRNQGQLEPLVTTPHDVHSLNPNMKLLVILRNPTTRLYSHYNFFTKDASPTEFHRKVLGSIQWWKQCIKTKGLPRRNCAYGSPPEMPYVYDKLGEPFMWWNKGYNYSGEVRTSMYAIYAKEWLKVFPRENMLFIKTEEYSTDIVKTCSEIYRFLEIDAPNDNIIDQIATKKKKAHKRSYKPILNATRETLEEFYKPFNKELADLLGDKKWLWID